MVKATSDSVVRAACGDRMSLNVLGKVILATLVAIGKVAPNNALDPWKESNFQKQKEIGKPLSDFVFEKNVCSRK